ncbi:hypothetical protein KDI_55240 [Dictyobacter arantiisoli]|uniref:Uncharacterized protein n=1 Tax=Dictyobacter arantiisoli TaxID=2014874 RepID=A0A5A5TK14_9CHLR|nr:hypothetical protein KDI_55240 [Dictyobacter arantiisoli]
MIDQQGRKQARASQQEQAGQPREVFATDVALRCDRRAQNNPVQTLGMIAADLVAGAERQDEREEEARGPQVRPARPGFVAVTGSAEGANEEHNQHHEPGDPVAPDQPEFQFHDDPEVVHT